MAVMNLKQRTGGTSTGEARPILPTDVYRMKCISAELRDDIFKTVGPDGTLPQKISTTWEVSTLTEEQQEAAEEAGEDWSEVRIWRDFQPYYGSIKAGGPSQFKAFIDNLFGQGYVQEFDELSFDTDWLVGIEQRCSVERYIKTMGENAGKPGNKITAFSAVRRGKTEKAAPAAPAPRNIPQPLPEEVDAMSDIPF